MLALNNGITSSIPNKILGSNYGAIQPHYCFYLLCRVYPRCFERTYWREYSVGMLAMN